MVSAPGLLDHIQRQLEGLYDVRSPAQVSAFLIDRSSAESLGARVKAPEEVFLIEGDDGADLGLYLSPALFERLRGKDPAARSGLALVTGELPAFAAVAEGVSHVLYLLRCAEAGRQVSKLELEVQAEVDKFAVSALHLWGRGLRAGVTELCRVLFDRATLRRDLTAEERRRYRDAGAIGGHYARYLNERYVKPGRLDGFVRDLRETYRLLASEKLRAFASAG